MAEFVACVGWGWVCVVFGARGQGYGMTESAAAVTVCLPSDVSVGHVGPPLQSVEICLEDVEEVFFLFPFVGRLPVHPPCVRVHR